MGSGKTKKWPPAYEKPRWKVHVLGDIERRFELSVIHESMNQITWGWGGPKKIILFGSGGENQLNPNTPTQRAFAMQVAEALCKALNAGLGRDELWQMYGRPEANSERIPEW